MENIKMLPSLTLYLDDGGVVFFAYDVHSCMASVENMFEPSYTFGGDLLHSAVVGKGLQFEGSPKDCVSAVLDNEPSVLSYEWGQDVGGDYVCEDN